MAELPSLREPQWAWLSRQINDDRLSAEEVVSIVKHHPWVKKALDLAQDVPPGWSSELEAARIKLCEALVTHADTAASFGLESLEADVRDAEQALTILGSLVWPPKPWTIPPTADVEGLAPCPFCGQGSTHYGGLFRYQAESKTYPGKTDHWIQCGGCGARGPGSNDPHDAPRSAEEAVRRWNARSVPPPVNLDPSMNRRGPMASDIAREGWSDHDGSRSPPTELLGTTQRVEVEYSNGHTRSGISPNAVAWKDVKRWRLAR